MAGQGVPSMSSSNVNQSATGRTHAAPSPLQPGFQHSLDNCSNAYSSMQQNDVRRNITSIRDTSVNHYSVGSRNIRAVGNNTGVNHTTNMTQNNIEAGAISDT